MLKRSTEEETDPLLTCKFSDKEFDFVGYIVIDSAIRGRCCGGVRTSSEVTLEETIWLAKNMTLKYGFLGIPLGGAKVGIRIRGSLSKLKRKLAFTKVGKILSPFITGGSYSTGTDMGTSDEDIDCLLNAATNEQKNWKHAPTPVYTSWTMLVSALEALNQLGLELDDSTVAIEGFGKIGSSAANVFSESGARIIAISTQKGAIYNSKGLNVTKLLELKREYGDDIVNYYTAAKKITKSALMCLPADILLPCAGSWTISSANAHKLKTKIICPGANIPLTGEAEEILFNRKVISLPDFVSNCGGVLGAFMGSLVSEQGKKEIIEKYFGKRVSQVIQFSREEGIPPIKVAQKIAMVRFNETRAKSETGDLKKRVSQLVKQTIPKIYREIFVKPRAKNVFIRMLHSAE